MQYSRRLPLKGLKNARDLGGFAVPGGVTRFGVFIRSEIPSDLPADDIAMLRDYGVRTAVDLRGAAELELKPDVLRYEDFIKYIHIPMADRIAAQGADRKLVQPVDDTFRWGTHYISMCEHQREWAKRVLTAMAEEPGAVLFHCTTGKDRAGISTALILGLCGADDMDIAADYCVSEIYLKTFYESMNSFVPDGYRQEKYHPEFFSTAHANMFMLLEHFNKQYGGIRGYVDSCGVGEDIVRAIRDRLVNIS